VLSYNRLNKAAIMISYYYKTEFGTHKKRKKNKIKRDIAPVELKKQFVNEYSFP